MPDIMLDTLQIILFNFHNITMRKYLSYSAGINPEQRYKLQTGAVTGS